MGLKTDQQAALDRLAALVTVGTTGIQRVYTDPPTKIEELPALVVFDDGMQPVRAGQWQEIEWRWKLQVFVQIGTLELALKKVRDIRGDLIDRLDTDITLNGTVSRTLFVAPLRLVEIKWAGVDYAGIDGTYQLFLKSGKAYS